MRTKYPSNVFMSLYWYIHAFMDSLSTLGTAACHQALPSTLCIQPRTHLVQARIPYLHLRNVQLKSIDVRLQHKLGNLIFSPRTCSDDNSFRGILLACFISGFIFLQFLATLLDVFLISAQKRGYSLEKQC